MSVRIFSENFLDADLIASQNPSSEQASFPASNVLAFERRSKVWRTGGYWLIDATNDEIQFEETTSVTLTANVANAAYTSTTALLAAIKTAMEAVGGSTYTVEIDTSTLKIKFTSDGAGGGGIFTIDWPNSNIATILGFDTGASDSGALTYTADILKIHTEEFFEFDLGAPANPKAFALIGGRNKSIKISPTATLNLEGNETDTWTSPTSQTSLSYDDEVICSVSATGIFGQNLRYARLSIADASNTNGYVEIGSLFLGDYFEGTRGKVQFPFVGEHIDRSRTAFSEGGQTFSDIREKTERFSCNWFGLTVSEKEQIDDLFQQLGTSQPFFVQFDSNPDLGFSGRKEKYIRYVKFERAPTYQLESPKNFSCRMIFLEEL